MSQDSDRGILLAVAAVAAMVIAYLLAFSIFTDTNMASKFENGTAPPGTDVVGIRTTAVASVVAAAGAWGAAIASDKAFAAVLVLMASVPFALLSLVTLGLAF